jgi:predicted nucleic acid-binding protein
VAIKGILLDTNAYAAFKQNNSDAVEIIRCMPLIAISSIVLGELLAGFAVGKREKANREELNCFLNSARVKLFSANQNTAECYAKIYQNLRQKGKPIPTNDMWIAAIAIQHGLPIFSYDSHFEYVEGIISGSCLSDFIVSESR